MSALRIPDLEGKAYLVTGASIGIGAAVARALGQQGAAVAVHYNSSKKDPLLWMSQQFQKIKSFKSILEGFPIGREEKIIHRP